MHGPTFTATRTAFLDGLTVASAAALDWVASAAGGTRLAQFRALGGAVRHAPADSTSYGHRDTPVLAFLSAASPDPSDSAVQDQAVDRLGRGLQLRRSGAYVTFLGTGAEEAVRAA